MGMKKTVYNRLPEPLKPFVKHAYQQVFDPTVDADLHSKFVEDFFEGRSEYDGYIDEIENGSAVDLRNKALQEFQQLTGSENLYGVGLDAAKDYYAITRKIKPDTVIETGVCNGVSSLFILLALNKNGVGTLYSIDYPLRADESLEEFRKETFEGYGGAVIPSDKDPGWIIPSELKSHWDLTIGKSQRQFPQLVTELEGLDLFIHDSEHSHPCMMFEYELAYEWLENKGVILSDDISWNDAFSVFIDVRGPEYGRLSQNIGYIRKADEG